MTFWDIFKIFLVLGILSGLFYFLMLVLKKYVFLNNTKNAKLINIKVLSTQLIMPKKYISVIKIRNKVYTVGVCDTSITLLDKTEDEKNEFDFNEVEKGVSSNFWNQLKKNLIVK